MCTPQNETIPHISVQRVVRDNTWAGVWPGPSHSWAGPRKRRTGSYRVRFYWVAISMSSGDPGQVDKLENFVGFNTAPVCNGSSGEQFEPGIGI